MHRLIPRIHRTLERLPIDTIHATLASPVGQLTLLASASGLHAILFTRDLEDELCSRFVRGFARDRAHPIIEQATTELARYFEGSLKQFGVPLALAGTPFEMSAWRVLQTIPFGETLSYGAQAEALGDTRKARAVGGANGRNPLSIVVPCHRVIAGDGALTGFGGGIAHKAWLLAHEVKWA